MRLYIHIILIILIGTITSCKSTDSSSSTDIKEDFIHEDQVHEDGVELTREQIQHLELEVTPYELSTWQRPTSVAGKVHVPNTSKAVITPILAGRIQSINLEEGAYVKKGQWIATIENHQFLEMQEEYLKAFSEFTLAEQEWQRQKDLYAVKAGAKKNSEVAESNYKGLEARVYSLRKQLQMIGVNPKALTPQNMTQTMRIYSPIDGIVTYVHAFLNSYVNEQTPIMEIVNNQNLHLDLHVFEQDLQNIEVNQIVHFNRTNAPEKSYQAKVYNIGRQIDENTKTLLVHAKVLDGGTDLFDGVNVLAQIVQQDLAAQWVVKEQAVVKTDEGSVIFYALQSDWEKGEHVFFKTLKVNIENQVQDRISITPLEDLPENIVIVQKGAFFLKGILEEDFDHHH